MITPTPNTHDTKFIVSCITFLGSLAIVCGSFLLWKGFQSGEILVSSGGVAAISGLTGMLSMQKPQSSPSTPDSVQVVNKDTDKVPVVEGSK
jgi:hypothetical protein